MAHTIREIIEWAQNEIDVLKHPDLRVFRDAVNPILADLKLGTLSEYDKVENIYYLNGNLHITYSYSVRCCETSDTVKIPTELLDFPGNAKRWKITNDIKKHESKIKGHEEGIEKSKFEIFVLRTALEDLDEDV
ncbi:hypothetical protein Ab1vBOLIVR5_gp51c [Agrobacterium phage OLIVR5]|uniref:Uncharacterized protein n=1 Tax=Agrobacterium phage OLIVR5 TaxID=2723773 RepID=A0A858MSW9_9CAUD|nr:hypothetical protein KNU99_gp051 [Agrobacterium phage OLIVR5]QIW87699.1 hypothetical protein Ab1vBOLIVR5_gp51c [Agrobacterium phage OLIVR5]QIW87961.1 hypothetical protein Ab1vBOLIVR6_gp54c [Agrobacterium phage OLIVR6]